MTAWGRVDVSGARGDFSRNRVRDSFRHRAREGSFQVGLPGMEGLRVVEKLAMLASTRHQSPAVLMYRQARINILVYQRAGTKIEGVIAWSSASSILLDGLSVANKIHFE
ncbi:hypothetical protein AMTR_s00088p00085220, partial [Amborella trichopoda]